MTPARSAELRAYAMLVLVMLFWSGNAIVGRAVRGDVLPFTLAFGRWLGAFLVLAPFALRHVAADREVLLRHWRPVLFLGLVGVSAFNAFMYSGLRYTTATNGLLLQAAIPALVLIIDALAFRVRAPAWQVVGVVLSILGVGVVLFPDFASVLRLHFGRGDALVLAGVVAWAIYTSLLRLRPDVHALSFLAVTFAIGVAAMLPLAMLEWRHAPAIDWRPEIVGAFIYVALFPSLAAYFLFNAAVGMIGAAKAGQSITLMPVFGALLAAALLGEPLGTRYFAGMALILCGIGVSVFLARGPKRGLR
ncbi:DMT family transporter [uncultured Sphingosinicella sp.]|uniref:DMT family transporter n=1 Tax=uncultured Sphingosinicella sp. TaxID=478748 RepID=UPI0030DB2D73|tara:strand:- start:1135 stop:2049 length:915 start_codon:yes stop_codon:yes gene_type:complete